MKQLGVVTIACKPIYLNSWAIFAALFLTSLFSVMIIHIKSYISFPRAIAITKNKLVRKSAAKIAQEFKYIGLQAIVTTPNCFIFYSKGSIILKRVFFQRKIFTYFRLT